MEFVEIHTQLLAVFQQDGEYDSLSLSHFDHYSLFGNRTEGSTANTKLLLNMILYHFCPPPILKASSFLIE
jgi:hypothetical protein